MIESNDFRLTVGALKKSLEGVDDETPVYYQRIEDFYFSEHGWTVSKMTWQDGEESEYIRAFSSFKHPGDSVFIINAHY